MTALASGHAGFRIDLVFTPPTVPTNKTTASLKKKRKLLTDPISWLSMEQNHLTYVLVNSAASPIIFFSANLYHTKPAYKH